MLSCDNLINCTRTAIWKKLVGKIRLPLNFENLECCDGNALKNKIAILALMNVLITSTLFREDILCPAINSTVVIVVTLNQLHSVRKSLTWYGNALCHAWTDLLAEENPNANESAAAKWFRMKCIQYFCGRLPMIFSNTMLIKYKSKYALV